MSSFSICDFCMGNSSDIRMTKIPDGANCKICTFAFDVYQFKQSERSATMMKTLICNNCAQQRNICQCCLLDKEWHISIDERDSLISLIKGYNVTTKEAQNEMMKRFLAIKDKDKKLGGAKMISDSDELNELMVQMRVTLESEKQKQNSRENKLEALSSKDVAQHGNSVNIGMILDKLPLHKTFDNESTKDCTCFFLFNVDSSLAEWQINDAISKIVKDDNWKESQSSMSMIINHKAQCGGIKFKNLQLGNLFSNKIVEDKSILPTRENKQFGILKIDQYRVFVLPWIKGFSLSSFGNDQKEYNMLSLSLRNFISTQMSPRVKPSNSNKVVKKPHPTYDKRSNKAPKKKRNHSKRAANLEL